MWAVPTLDLQGATGLSIPLPPSLAGSAAGGSTTLGGTLTSLKLVLLLLK